MITPRRAVDQPEYPAQNVQLQRFTTQILQHQHSDLSITELDRFQTILTVLKKAFSMIGVHEASKRAEIGTKYLAVVISGRMVLSGNALKDLEKYLFSIDPEGREKFWSSAYFVTQLVTIPTELIDLHFKERALKVALEMGKISTGPLNQLLNITNVKKIEAGASVAFEKLRNIPANAPLRERVIRHTGFIAESTSLMQIAAAALGYSNVSIGLAILSKSAGFIKMFTRKENFTSHQVEWEKEFLGMKEETFTLIKNQFEEAIEKLKSGEGIPRDLKDRQIAGLKIAVRANRQAIMEAPDEEILMRSLLYFSRESHSLFTNRLFKEWKADEIISLCDRCTLLKERKDGSVKQTVQSLHHQIKHIEKLEKSLDDGLNNLSTIYREDNPVREFMVEEINSVKGLLKEELKKVDAMLQEKEQCIDMQPHPPMFEAHELTEDLSKRYNISNWIDRADTLKNDKHKSYLEKKVELALKKPTMIDIFQL